MPAFLSIHNMAWIGVLFPYICHFLLWIDKNNLTFHITWTINFFAIEIFPSYRSLSFPITNTYKILQPSLHFLIQILSLPLPVLFQLHLLFQFSLALIAPTTSSLHVHYVKSLLSLMMSTLTIDMHVQFSLHLLHVKFPPLSISLSLSTFTTSKFSLSFSLFLSLTNRTISTNAKHVHFLHFHLDNYNHACSSPLLPFPSHIFTK